VDITAGKDYPAMGSLSVFNPFELRKSLNLTDLKYDREGILLLRTDVSLGRLSGVKAYVSPSSPLENSVAGLSIFGHALTFDAGAVLQRKAGDMNAFGFFLRGDLLLEVNAAWSCHFDDRGGSRWNEAAAGADYSFFDGRLLASGTWYYAEKKPGPGVDRFLTARHYALVSLSFAPDDFLVLAADLFMNAVEGSCLVIPSVRVTVSDGLTATLLVSAATGGMNDEFSGRRFGNLAAGLRIEAKL
jgi:hypothetical protein